MIWCCFLLRFDAKRCQLMCYFVSWCDVTWCNVIWIDDRRRDEVRRDMMYGVGRYLLHEDVRLDDLAHSVWWIGCTDYHVHHRQRLIELPFRSHCLCVKHEHLLVLGEQQLRLCYTCLHSLLIIFSGRNAGLIEWHGMAWHHTIWEVRCVEMEDTVLLK